jgi:quercetin dioxygenase-like cupin family protein
MEQLHGIWGNRLKTFQWDGGLVTLLFLEPKKRCSWHKHERTFNQFTCIKGKFGIKTDKGYTTILTKKQTFTVEPAVFHEFQTYDEPAIIEEIAYIKYEEHDIIREKLGGDLSEDDF